MARDAFQLQGLDGGVVLGDGETAPAGNYRWMKVIADTVLSTFTSNLDGSSTKLITITLPAGTEIGGIIDDVVVTTGLIILYKISS